MKQETAAFLAKANELIRRAPALLAQDFTDQAGCARSRGRIIITGNPGEYTCLPVLTEHSRRLRWVQVGGNTFIFCATAKISKITHNIYREL